MRIYGEVNDYAGKGLSGGRMIVRPEDTVTFDKHSNVIAGNVTVSAPLPARCSWPDAPANVSAFVTARHVCGRRRGRPRLRGT